MSTIPPTPLPENGEESPKNDARTWERWIKGIGFGIYILAALGILFYAGPAQT